MPEPLPTWLSGDVRELRAFAHVRLVVADLDGTLVRPMTDQVSNTIHDLARKLRAKRPYVKFTVATGRAFRGVGGLLRNLQLRDDTPIALYNGSLVLRPGGGPPLSINSISPAAFRRVALAAEQAGATLLAYRYDIPAPALLSTAAECVFGWGPRCPDQEINGLRVIVGSDFHSLALSPIAMLIESERGTPQWDILLRELERVDGVWATSSSARFIEVRPAGITKATALQRIADEMQIARHEILAIGDNDNDAEMLSWAGVGVAVQGASEMALSQSRFYCQHAVGEGVVEVLRLLRQARRFGKYLAVQDPLGVSIDEHSIVE